MNHTEEQQAQYAYDLRTLILEHEEVIERMEHRLESMSMEKESLAQVSKTQIEFIIINMKTSKQVKEQELRSLESQIRWMKENSPFPLPSAPFSSQPLVSPFQPPFDIDSIDGDEVIATCVYQCVKPGASHIANVVFLTKSGKLMNPTVKHEEWVPGEDWKLADKLPRPKPIVAAPARP